MGTAHIRGDNEIETVCEGDVIYRADEYRREGFRLVQICCTELTDSLEVTYLFDKGYRLKGLRVHLASPAHLTSISSIFPGAFVYENEIHDLFGLEVAGMTTDYHGTFIRTAKKHPFRSDQVTRTPPTEGKGGDTP